MEGLLQSSAPLPEALQDPEEGQGKTRGAAGRGGGARAEAGVSGAWHDRVRGVVEGAELGRGGAEWNLVGIRGGVGREPGLFCCGCALRLLAVSPGERGGGGGCDGDGGGGGGSAGRDAALPAGCRAVPGLRLLLAAVRLQPARSVLGGRSGRRSQAAGRGDGFLAGGRRTRPRERRGQRGLWPAGQVRAAV